MSGAEFNWADWVIIGVLLLSAVVSLLRGLVVEVASLAIAVIGALLAFHFAAPAAERFLQGIEVIPLRTGIAALAIYVLTSIIGALALYLLKRLIQGAGLSGTDRLLGLIFGVARGLLIAIALHWVGLLMRLDQSAWWQQSALMPGIARAAEGLILFLPANVREMIADPATGATTLQQMALPTSPLGTSPAGQPAAPQPVQQQSPAEAPVAEDQPASEQH